MVTSHQVTTAKSATEIGELIVPRCYCLNLVTDPIVNVELHGFSDASEVAYAGCVYLKSVARSGCTKVSLVTAKSRIVPNSKAETIPRLELLGSLVLSKLMASVVVALDNELPVKKVFCWTDSTIALSWIKAVSKEFKTFVQNRVSIIRKNVNENQWYYCRTEVNPADIITRSGGDVNSDRWLNGPEFLYNPIVNTACNVTVEPPGFQLELSSNTLTFVVVQTDPKGRELEMLST